MKTKQLLSVLFVCALFLACFAFPVSAETAEQLSYISQNDSLLLAEEIINNRIGRDDCPWTNETTVSETVQLFDFDGNINGYIFRLATAGKPTGYPPTGGISHAVLGLGYQNCSDGNWIRIADGLNTGISNF